MGEEVTAILVDEETGEQFAVVLQPEASRFGGFRGEHVSKLFADFMGSVAVGVTVEAIADALFR